MKLSRISLVIAVALLAIVALTVSANAFSNEDLATYLTTTHMISGTQYKLTDANAVQVKDYLTQHPVTDAQAAQIKSLLEQALAKVSGDNALSQLTQAEKDQIISLVQQAGNIAGVTVTFNTAANTVTVSGSGAVILSGSYVNDGNGGVTVKYTNGGSGSSSAGAAAGTAANGGSRAFVYTGANNSVFAVIALLAVVAVSTVLVKKAYAK